MRLLARSLFDRTAEIKEWPRVTRSTPTHAPCCWQAAKPERETPRARIVPACDALCARQRYSDVAVLNLERQFGHDRRPQRWLYRGIRLLPIIPVLGSNPGGPCLELRAGCSIDSESRG
jgi:hypothetical protein